MNIPTIEEPTFGDDVFFGLAKAFTFLHNEKKVVISETEYGEHWMKIANTVLHALNNQLFEYMFNGYSVQVRNCEWATSVQLEPKFD